MQPPSRSSVSVGQSARLRFSTFNQDETPQVDGTITAVSADAITEEATGPTFYEVMIEIPEDTLASTGFQLLPGMPVEASLTAESRNVLSYRVKPLTDSVSRTFRE